MTNDLTFKAGLASILHSLDTALMSESEAVMVLQGLIDREIDLPAYIAFKHAMVHPEASNLPDPIHEMQHRREVARRRAGLMAIDDPAYILRQARDST